MPSILVKTTCNNGVKVEIVGREEILLKSSSTNDTVGFFTTTNGEDLLLMAYPYLQPYLGIIRAFSKEVSGVSHSGHSVGLAAYPMVQIESHKNLELALGYLSDNIFPETEREIELYNKSKKRN